MPFHEKSIYQVQNRQAKDLVRDIQILNVIENVAVESYRVKLTIVVTVARGVKYVTNNSNKKYNGNRILMGAHTGHSK